MEEDFEDFLHLLLTATGGLEPHYFLFHVAGAEDVIHRERVYCYGLYHRIRECMPNRYPICAWTDGGQVLQSHNAGDGVESAPD
ncbi:MAG: hypothetical protein ACE5FB_08865 [Candidatus Binatia bacterium]